MAELVCRNPHLLLWCSTSIRKRCHIFYLKTYAWMDIAEYTSFWRQTLSTTSSFWASSSTHIVGNPATFERTKIAIYEQRRPYAVWFYLSFVPIFICLLFTSSSHPFEHFCSSWASPWFHTYLFPKLHPNHLPYDSRLIAQFLHMTLIIFELVSRYNAPFFLSAAWRL